MFCSTQRRSLLKRLRTLWQSSNTTTKNMMKSMSESRFFNYHPIYNHMQFLYFIIFSVQLMFWAWVRIFDLHMTRAICMHYCILCTSPYYLQCWDSYISISFVNLCLLTKKTLQCTLSRAHLFKPLTWGPMWACIFKSHINYSPERS